MNKIFSLATLFVALASAVDPVVNLSYSSYRGKELDNGITQWLGMRYAAPPVGSLRFKLPRDPISNDTEQDATDWNYVCIGTDQELDDIGKTHSEDCLFINVFAPSEVSPGAKLPVFFFLQGGGFQSNANPILNGSSLIQSGDMDMIVVTLNYRVGVYGFLSDGDKVAPNVGLHDQRKGLEWVQQHIASFGGDPDHVTLGGLSAGAASVRFHLTAYGGRDDGLFHAAAAQSVSFGTMLTANESYYQYESLAIRLGCVGKDVLECIRSKSATDIQKANQISPYPGNLEAPLYMWTPVVDGDFIPDVGHTLFEQGKFINVPTITGDDTNGGTIFTSENTTTLAQSNEYIKTQFPFITLDQLAKINALYPNKDDSCPDRGCYWRQVSDVYGDMRYMCPGIYISNSLRQHGVSKVWNYRYNVEDPEYMALGVGVPHTVEVFAIFGPEGDLAPSSYFEGEINERAIPVLQGYWSSFVRSFDPNKYRANGTAKWETWDCKRQQRIVFETGGETKMEKVSRSLQKSCSYFGKIGAGLRQ